MAEQETQAELDDDNGAGEGGEELSAAEQVRQDNRRARRTAAARRRSRRKRELEEARAVGLDAGEMVDDALARSSDSAARWFIRHFKILQWMIVAGVAIWVVYTGVNWYQAGKNAEASDVLFDGLLAAEGRIQPEGESEPSPGDEYDTRPSFGSEEERTSAAAKAFEKASSYHEGSGTQALALLSEAGIHLDQGKYDEAKANYERVLAMKVSQKAPELKGRAQEGIAIALEGKGETEAALAAYKELGNQGTAGFVALAKLGQARLLDAQGKFQEAKTLVDEVLAETAKGDEKPSLFAAPSYTKQRAQELSDALLAAHPELKAATLPPPELSAPVDLAAPGAAAPVKVNLGAPASSAPASSAPASSAPASSETAPTEPTPADPAPAAPAPAPEGSSPEAPPSGE